MDNLKICTVCKLSKNKDDFIFDREECYKCEYARKCKKEEKIIKTKKCRICDNNVPDLRWIYCSSDCASEAKRNRKHWTNQCKVDTKDWKKRFNFFT